SGVLAGVGRLAAVGSGESVALTGPNLTDCRIASSVGRTASTRMPGVVQRKTIRMLLSCEGKPINVTTCPLAESVYDACTPGIPPTLTGVIGSVARRCAVCAR